MQDEFTLCQPNKFHEPLNSNYCPYLFIKKSFIMMEGGFSSSTVNAQVKVFASQLNNTTHDANITKIQVAI